MGFFSKFWNTNARPEGWLGRFALRMMNLTHTPMARWNLSFRLPARLDDARCGLRRWQEYSPHAETLSEGAGLWHRLFRGECCHVAKEEQTTAWLPLLHRAGQCDGVALRGWQVRPCDSLRDGLFLAGSEQVFLRGISCVEARRHVHVLLCPRLQCDHALLGRTDRCDEYPANGRDYQNFGRCRL